MDRIRVGVLVFVFMSVFINFNGRYFLGQSCDWFFELERYVWLERLSFSLGGMMWTILHMMIGEMDIFSWTRVQVVGNVLVI